MLLTTPSNSQEKDAPKRRTAVLDANGVDAAAEDSGVGIVAVQSRGGEGALLAEGASLDISRLNNLVFVRRIDGGGHGGVGVLSDGRQGRGERCR